MDEKTTYSMNVDCKNCEHQWVHEIPKGRLAVGGIPCPFCGCEEGEPNGKFEPEDCKTAVK